MDHREAFYGQQRICKHSIRAKDVHKGNVNVQTDVNIRMFTLKG